MIFDENQKIEIKELYDDELLNNIDNNNVYNTYQYLINNKIYFAEDIILEYLDLCNDFNLFKEKFEKLKIILGKDYLKKLEEDFSIFATMYDI